MTKFRNINILSISALIPLFSAFLFPFMKHETESYIVTFFWIWGLPYYSSFRALITITFTLLSIGIAVEIVLFLKSYIIFLRDNMKIDIVSKGWRLRGREIILLELLWILCLLFLIYFYYPFGIYYIEVPIFLPLIGGIMLIIDGNLSSRLEIDKDHVLYKESKFKTIHRLYIFVFILYSIFFSIFFTILIFPDLYFNYTIFYYVLYGSYYFGPLLLTLLIMKFDTFLGNIKVNNLHEHKQLNKLYVMTLVIIGILVLIYFLLNWMRPTIRILFGEGSFD